MMSNTRPITITVRGAVLSLVFLEDGKHFLSGGEDKMIRQWSVEDGREIGPPFRMNSDIWALALSNDRNWIISGEANAVATVWSRKTRQSALTVNAHLDKVYTVDVSPDSTKFATGSRDFRAFIWDLATGRRLVGPLHHDYWVVSVRFSPDGNRIATTTSLHTSIRVYNVHNAECLADISVLSSARNTIAWSRDSQFIFALSSDALSRIHIDSGALRSKWTVPGETLSMTGSVALSSNGGFIASYVGSSLTLWDTWTRRRLGPVLDHPTGPLRSITLSLDDKYVAAGSQNGTITIHNLDNIKPTTSHPVISQRDAQQRETGTHGAAPEQQIEALRDALHALEIRFDALTRTTTLMNDRLQALQATPPRVPYGTYRIKTNTSDVYLTCPQGVPGTVVVQPFDKSSVSQRWIVSSATDGAYSIVGRIGNSDIPLSTGNANQLVCDPDRAPVNWTFEPRGNAYVIGNAVNATAIHLARRRQFVSVIPRNNNPNQRWVLEPVSN